MLGKWGFWTRGTTKLSRPDVKLPLFVNRVSQYELAASAVERATTDRRRDCWRLALADRKSLLSI
jgi:hypothetical protein